MSQAQTSQANFPYLATLFTLLGILILLALGKWQLERLEWKRSILAAIDAQKDIQVFERKLSLKDIKNAARRDYPFIRGYITGHYLADHSISFEPRTNKSSEVGAHLVQAFKPDNGNFLIIVNRGWIPKNTESEMALSSKNSIKLGGHFKPFPSGNIFTPSNMPDQGHWILPKIQDLKEYWSLDKTAESIAPLLLYVEKEKPINPQKSRLSDRYPEPFSKDFRPRNKHMQYAIFWFSMAGILFGVYTLRFLYPYLKEKRAKSG